MSETFDLLVIGSGPGGYRAAVLGALRGLRVAVVERAQWGGCCLNRGCVPKKDWYHSAQLVAANKHLAGRGIRGTLSADMAQAWEHQEAVVERVQSSYVDYMKRLNIGAFEGHAQFEDPHTIRIEAKDGTTQTLNAKHIIIATGGVPYVPAPFEPVPGKIITSDMLFDERPPKGKRVVIIGSGVIATEFAFIFKMLGKDVTWLARSAMLRKIPYSPQALGTLKHALAEHDVHMREGLSASAVNITDTAVELTLDNGERIETDWVFLGTGREPHTAGLNLDKAGVKVDARGFIQRNDYLQTAAEHIYAIGDVAGEWMTANHALSDATLAVENIIQGPTRKQDGLWVPLVVYSAAELARLGMDDDMAEDEDFEPAVGFAAFETNPRALGQDESTGFVRLIADMDSGRLLGGEIVGAEAGELIHLLSLAPDRDTALKWLASGTYNHPARSEELINATETLAGKWGLKDEIFG